MNWKQRVCAGRLTVISTAPDTCLVVAQINEIALITNTLHELNSKHARLRQTYEQEVTALRAQLHEAQRQVALAANAHHSVSAPPPGPGGLPPGVPSQHDAYYARERDREIKDRDRMMVERERDREPVRCRTTPHAGV